MANILFNLILFIALYVKNKFGVNKSGCLHYATTVSHCHLRCTVSTIKGILTLAARSPLDPRPPDREHCRMMIHVQEADLFVLLSYDEEERVNKLDQLGEVIPPEGPSDLKTTNGDIEK